MNTFLLFYIKDHNGKKIIVKTSTRIFQKSDNLNKIETFYLNDHLGLKEFDTDI